MANERIGRIESIEGQATAEHADGSNEALVNGSRVYIDDVVITGKGTHLSIRLLDGSVIELGPEQSQKLDSQLTDAAGDHVANFDAGIAVDAIGVLVRANGDVQVVRDGVSISLHVGDPVYIGDIVKTGDYGSATLTMTDGSRISLGHDFILDLNDPIITDAFTKNLESGLEEATSIQEAIRAGSDPSEDVPAPGAGEFRSSEGGDAVILQASTRAVTPESGHETHGQELPFRIPDHELLLNPVELPGNAPVVSIGDGLPAPAVEGTDGTITFTVTLSNASDVPVTVDYAAVDGSATGGEDYVLVPGTLTFAAGEVSRDITVTVLDDAVYEDAESFSVVLSNADAAGTALSIVDATGTGSIVDNDTDTFPTGLAYTVAGSKMIAGEQLYGIDLETGQTTRIGEVQVYGSSLNPNAVGGMSLNPLDGYLYAVTSSGKDSYLLKINPATAQTEVIDSTNNFSKATAATHGVDGTLYLSFGNQIFIYDTANPGTTNSLTLIAQGAKSLAVDAIAINTTGDTMYLANGDELWSVSIVPGGSLESPVLIGAVRETIGSTSTAYTLDGMSFDDSGVLWGLDNAGNILRINIDDASAENVTTISNNEVRGGGTDSLAISNVDPGAYVVFSDATTTDAAGLTVQDRADSYTHYIPAHEVSTNTILDESDLGIGSATTANVEIATGANGDIAVSNLSSSDVDNVYIKADTDKTVSVEGFDSVDVTTRGEQNSNITITGAERGVIDTGEGEDHVSIITDPLVGDGGTDETFVVSTDGGDDVIMLSQGALSNSDFLIDAGEHMDGSESVLDFDILKIDDDIDLGALNLDIRNVEGIDVTGSGNNTVQLSAQDVLDMTDGGNILRVDGDMTDAVQVLDPGWVQGADQMVGSINYHTFTSNGVSLLVNEDMQLLGSISIP